MGKRAMLIAFACVLPLGFVVVALAGEVAGGASPAATAMAAAQPASGASGLGAALLVVRRAGARDDLARLAGETSQTVGALPGRALRAVRAPDGSAVAYLPMKGGPRFWVATPSGEVKTVSLIALGVTSVEALTWTSPTQLVVAGSKQRREPYPAKDHLYEVTAGTWTVRPFRGLRGAEPSAAPQVGTLVFVRITDVGKAPGLPWARKLREQLLLLDLDSAAAPKVIKTETYPSTLDIRAFREPQLAPDGRHVATSTSGSDVSVTYRIWSIHVGKALYEKRTACLGPAIGAWDATGTRLAFCGLVSTPDWDMMARVWIYDLAKGTVSRSDLLGRFESLSVAWSASGDLAVARSRLGRALDEGTTYLASGESLSALTRLLDGGLPVWVQ
jgi:hypothetical protein